MQQTTQLANEYSHIQQQLKQSMGGSSSVSAQNLQNINIAGA